MASSQSTNREAEEYIWPHQAPLLERLTSQDEATVEDELNKDLGYPSLGGAHHRNWVERATDYGSRFLSWFRRNTRGRYEDWLFLVMLGGLMGLYSFGIDVAVMTANQYRLAAFKMAGDMASGVVIWLMLTAAVSTSAALFLAWFIPSATGSGFPEIKAYLQGVKMENTFSPLTCIGKLVFLPIMLCTALPLGKEGPVTHVAAVFALFITKVFKDISVEELERHKGNELVAAACTMGAAVCYGAPVGGVLFSIESTRTYFAVRNYWRGFFAAVCGTVFYKGLSQIYHGIDILPMYQETYTMALPFNFEFLGISVGIGLLCGLLGPLFVWTHRQLLQLIQRVNAVSPQCRCRCCPDRADAKGDQPNTCRLGLTKHKVTVFRLLYTIMVCVMMGAVILPWRDGYSPVMSHISTRQQMTDLMANVSWESTLRTNNDTAPCAPGGDSRNCSLSVDATDGDTEEYRSQLIRSRWTDDFSLDYRAVLVLYMLFYFFGTMISTTLTLPSGTLIPIFKVGVAMGRLLGEFYCSHRLSVCAANSAVASGFACMCGAAMAASVTHSISISVIVFELTGQITYVLPVLTSVLVANALSRHLQPSMVDSLTSAKNITVLPKIVLSKIQGGYANIHARDLMTTQFVVVTRRATLNSLRKLVRCVKNPAKVLPLVDDEVNMEPLGLVHVRRVRRLLREELGNTAWQRDRPRFYLTLNAFKALDWESVRGNAAVGRLGLEVTPSFRASSSSPRPERQRRGSLTRLTTIDPETYCTVASGTQTKVRWDLVRRKLSQPKDADLSSKTRRPAIKISTGNGTTPLSAEGRTPAGDQRETNTKWSRFSVKKIPEASLESVPLANLRKKEVLKGQQLNGVAESGVPSDVDDSGLDVLPLDGDSAASSDERPTDKLAPPPLDGRRRARRRSLIESPLKGGEQSEVYDSLVSESSRATRLRDGIAKYISKRSGALDLESHQQNAQERLQRQFSISDLYEGENDGLANMGQLIQRTLDRTTQMFTGIANQQKEQPETEVRLRRAWRRHQLNREVELRDVLEVDTFPLAVNVDTPLVQVHKMFAMLCANKMYVMDRRRLVGCLPLQRLSEFITRGHLDNQTPASAYDTVTNLGEALTSRRHSQDTLDEVSDSVYDTVTGLPRVAEQQETSVV